MKQGSKEWFGARKGRVTGSMVGAILGLSPYMSRSDAMRSMVRESLGLPREFTGNVATSWGTAMEPQARMDFQMESSEIITDQPFVEYEDWLGASPDGLVSDGRLIEIKCPYGIRNDTPPEFKEADDQPHYLAQMQVQMFVTGRSSCWFYQWTPHGSLQKLIHRDDDWLADHISALRQFHAEFLDELANNAAEHSEPLRVTIDTPEAHRMAKEYDELAEQIALAEERKKDLLKEMVSMTGDRNALFAGRKLTRVDKAGAVSYAKAIKALLPQANLEPWRGAPSSYWMMK